MPVTPLPPSAAPAGPQAGPLAGATTWLCTFMVLVDMPATMNVADMEGLVAGALARDFSSLGLPANVSAQLVATAGNQTVLNPTQPMAVTPPTPMVPPV
jgi:hypothetical protein